MRIEQVACITGLCLLQDLQHDKTALQQDINDKLKQISALEMALDQLRYPAAGTTTAAAGTTAAVTDEEREQLKDELEMERQAVERKDKEVWSNRSSWSVADVCTTKRFPVI